MSQAALTGTMHLIVSSWALNAFDRAARNVQT
jgi:hypothetical protein